MNAPYPLNPQHPHIINDHIDSFLDLTDVHNYTLAMNRERYPYIQNQVLKDSLKKLHATEAANVILDYNVPVLDRLDLFKDNLLIPIGRNINIIGNVARLINRHYLPYSQIYPFKIDISQFEIDIYTINIHYIHINHAYEEINSTISNAILDEISDYLYMPKKFTYYGLAPYNHIRAKHLPIMHDLLTRHLTMEQMENNYIMYREFIITEQYIDNDYLKNTVGSINTGNLLNNYPFDSKEIIDLYLFNIRSENDEMHYSQYPINKAIILTFDPISNT